MEGGAVGHNFEVDYFFQPIIPIVEIRHILINDHI
jgi:hypothetical protein